MIIWLTMHNEPRFLCASGAVKSFNPNEVNDSAFCSSRCGDKWESEFAIREEAVADHYADVDRRYRDGEADVA
jgi:hypothetical protein